MKKATLLLLLATFVLTAGGHIHAIGSPGWGTGPKFGGNCLLTPAQIEIRTNKYETN